MKKLLIFAAAATTLALTSCYVDPYYGGSVGYSSSYAGGGGYSSSVFVSTGDARWAYDPYRYCYYDRYRSSYYDPYLYGYYPVGYVPTPVRGCPHPGNWSGSGYCPPPSNVKIRNLSRYDDRVSNYAAANYHWSRKVSSSGSSSWLNQSQRSQLNERASMRQQAPSSPGRGGLFGSGGFGSSPAEAPRSSGWSGSQSSRQTVQPRTFVTETPQIQPRNTGGGMFGGLDRTRSETRRIESSPRMEAPRIETPRMEIPRERQEAPRMEVPEPRIRESSGGGLRERDKSDNNDGGGMGGGLRKFQR